MTSSRTATWLAAAALVLAGCSAAKAPTDLGSDPLPRATSGASAGPPRPSPSPTALAPLTGRPVPAGQDATRPIVAVAVISGSGRPPPVGVERADLVYLAFPAADRQRALALFQSQDASRVGPVHDTRPMDSNLLIVLGAVLTHEGGAPWFVRRVDKSKLPQWSAVVRPSSFERDPSTGALYVSTMVARTAPGARRVPQGLLAFRPPAKVTRPPRPVRVAVPGQPELRLTFDVARGTWTGTVGSFSVRASNVLVQQVTYERLPLPGAGGHTEGHPTVFGTGRATVLTGGQVTAASWHRSGRAALTSFVAANGVPVRLLPGPTWVLLVPAGTSVGS